MNNRLDTFDGMRGIAAFVIFVHHGAPNLAHLQLMKSGYLAVDFFFMLSGFVLARSFEPKFANGLSPAAFMRIRVRRLWPAIAVGIFLSAIVAINLGYPKWQVWLLFVSQLAFVPLISGSLALYTLDGVQWSLLFELLANAVHGQIYAWSDKVIACGVFLSFLVFGLAAWTFGDVAIGDLGQNVIGGIPRVLFSYGLGILIYRAMKTGSFRRLRLPSVVTILMLPIAFALAAAVKAIAPDWLVDLLFVAGILPILLIAGANGAVSQRMRPTTRLFGSLSYPLYAVHLPIIAFVVTIHLPQSIGALAVGAAGATTAAYLVALLLEPRTPMRGYIRSLAGRGSVPG